MSCTVAGYESVIKLFDEISDADVRKVLSSIGDKAVSSMSGAVSVKSGATKGSIKKSIRKVESGIKLSVKIKNEYYVNQEYGASTSNPKNVQRVFRALRGIDDTAKKELEELVMKRK